MEMTKTNPGTDAVQTPMFTAPKKKRKWIWVLVILALVAAVVIFFVRSMLSAGQQLLASAYLTGQAQVRDITVQVSSTGTVTPIDSYRVTAQAMGEVLEAPFEEDEWVEKGQLLYLLDAKDAETSIHRSELSLEQSRLSLEQSQRSYDTTLENLTVTANASGTVQTLYVKVGDTVNAGSPIADIWDTSTVTIRLPFHAADAAALRVGQQGILTVEGSLEQLSGTIESISGADEVGAGGALLRQVEFRVNNPGGITTTTAATAVVDGRVCAGSGAFQYNVQRTAVAKTGGDITRLNVSAGDRVTNGQALCIIGGSAAENTLENARTSLENARISLETAQLSLDSARDALDDYRITAPISGTVVTKNFKVGDNIDSTAISAAGGSLALIYDMSTLTFQMQIDELDINKIQVGQQVTITADAVEGVTFTGVVDQLSISGTTISGKTTYPITVNIDDPGDLKPGMNVSADVIVDRVGQVLTVPVEAVNRGAERPYVLVAGASALDENGNVADIAALERREVTLGSNDENYIEITSGLAEGEIVVWENQVTNPLLAMMQSRMG